MEILDCVRESLYSGKHNGYHPSHGNYSLSFESLFGFWCLSMKMLKTDFRGCLVSGTVWFRGLFGFGTICFRGPFAFGDHLLSGTVPLHCRLLARLAKRIVRGSLGAPRGSGFFLPIIFIRCHLTSSKCHHLGIHSFCLS